MLQRPGVLIGSRVNSPCGASCVICRGSAARNRNWMEVAGPCDGRSGEDSSNGGVTCNCGVTCSSTACDCIVGDAGMQELLFDFDWQPLVRSAHPRRSAEVMCSFTAGSSVNV